MVYVLNQNGQPLMPTNRHGKVKHLLKDGKAKVIKRCPFTIQLLYDTTNYTQSLTLGVNTGSGTIGAAVSKCNGDILYMSKVIVRNNIVNRMTRRLMYRRNRRNRKTRYRKPRFLNRKNSIRKDRFSPTMISKFHSHIKEIEYIKSILPITTLVLETNSFNMFLLKKSKSGLDESNYWGHQKDINYDFENTKAMVRNRDGYKCQYCKGKHKDHKLEVHHIIYRRRGGSNDSENLITLCHTCHKALHNGEIDLNLKGKRKGAFKYATQMNSIRCQLLKHYPEAIETFGMVTKANRQKLCLNKDHHIDACVVASGGNPIQFITNTVFIKKSVSRGDKRQRKGPHSENQIHTGKLLGFRKFDKVKYFGKEYFIMGRTNKGFANLMDIEGNKIDFSFMPRKMKTPKLCNCIRIASRKSVLIDKMII